METLRETCLEYFRRRLNEGWKCISLEGYNAVLLSPNGIRREIDLRNDVETLRPNAPGDETSIANCVPGTGEEHWEDVDEEVADGGTTKVWSKTGAYQRDLYNLPASSGSGTINKITVYFRIRSPVGGVWAKASIKSNATVTDGAEKDVTTMWVTQSQEWATNPADDEAWEWSDIDDLQIGVSLKGVISPRPGSQSDCTQVYIEVDYTYTPPTPPVTPEYLKRETARIGSEAEATLKAILSRVTEFSADSGIATGGSQTTVVDSAKDWEADMWKGAVIEIYSVADDIYYLRTISSNTATTITHSALPAGKSVASGDSYAIRLTIGLVAIGERVISKSIRDIAPGAIGTFWLPETGNIDLSKYLASSWAIFAPTTATMVINCYLNISHDGGTTWRRAAGYEILDADFVRDEWNTIDCPLKLAEAKLEVVVATAYPAELDLMCIAKP